VSNTANERSKFRLVRLLFAAVFALLAIGATVAMASGTSIGLTSAFTGGSSIGLDALASARHHMPASLAERKRVAIRRQHRQHHRLTPASPTPSEPGVPAVPPSPSEPVTDSTAPQTSIASGPEASGTTTSASFTFTSSESASTFACELDGGGWEGCESPKLLSDLSVGSHQFSVRATDTVGNTDPSPATQSWNVEAPEPPDDTTAPQTSIAGGPAANTASTSASFTFSSSEPGSSFACKLDGGGWEACTSPKSYSGVSVGSRRFSVRAGDAAGNVDNSPATYEWTVEGSTPPPDTIPPNTSITNQPPDTTTASTAKFTFSATETGSTFECRLDSGTWVECSPPQTYGSVAVGEHEFLVRATDAADNVDDTPASADWTVESQSQPPPANGCTTTAASVSAVQSAVSSAAAGSVVCLSNGSYGQLSLNATKAAPGVTVRAANAGQATIAGASLQGSNLTLARFLSTGSIQIQPGANGMTVEHNKVTGGGQGIDACPSSSTTCNDMAIVGNELIGPFGEDAIHLNRYHDGDGNGVGVLIEGNEITNVRENGNHSDCLQTVWVGDHIVFRKNYLHDNRCQGFFVKDQASLGGVSGPIAGITVEDNLFVRNKEPCAPEAPGCGQPIYLQVFGPYSGFTMRRNTIWGDGADSIAAFREGTGSDTQIADNVIYRLWTDTNMSAATLTNNTVCKREAGSGGSWASARPGETTACSLGFQNAAADDYRIAGDRGVDWTPAEQHFGP
jgi:Right handed beta helix region